MEVWLAGAHSGMGHGQQQSWEVLLGINPLGGCHEPYYRACRLQGWVASGRTTNR